jgi:hypothetical protein
MMKGMFQTLVLAGLVVAAPLLGRTGITQAAQFRSGEKVIVKEDETVEEDLYVAGGEVIVDGTIEGDLVVFAGQVTVNGLVIGDLIAAGGTVLLNGTVDDDIRVAGGVLKLGTGAEVADDVVAAGLSAETENDGSIDGSVYYVGYEAKFAGSIGESLTAAMAHCELSGVVQGDVLLGLDPGKDFSPLLKLLPALPVPMPAVPAGLTVAPSTEINGSLAYRSPSEGNIDEGADIAGGIEYEPHALLSSSAAEPTNVDKAFALARHFATLAIIGLCVLVILPRWSQGLAESVRTRPLASVGSGLLGIVFLAILLLVLVVLIFGLMFALDQLKLNELAPVVWTVGALSVIGLLGGFWFFASYVAQIVVSLALGRFMLFAGKTKRRILPFLAGLVVLVVLMNLHRVTILPYVGQIINAIVVVVGTGGWVLWTIGSWSRRDKE